MKIKEIDKFLLESDTKLKGTDINVWTLKGLVPDNTNNYTYDYLGIMTFPNNELPQDDVLLELCQYKANEEMPYKYDFEGFKKYIKGWSLTLDVFTVTEASTIWGKDESTIRSLIKSGKLTFGVDYKKSGRITLITRNAMEKIYGKAINEK